MDAIRRIQQLRELRQRPERDHRVGGEVARIRETAARRDGRLGDLIDAWRQLMPPAIVEQTRLEDASGGGLVVIAASSSVSFDVSRRLRAGAERELRKRASGTLGRIRVRVGAIE